MIEQATLQDRVATLEQEMSALKRRVERREQDQAAKSWFNVMAGEVANNPTLRKSCGSARVLPVAGSRRRRLSTPVMLA